ncbi:MAG: hypothetical protein L0387_33350 [Acidobacteria bacterium]|nr:hypothetical protein [Acidobacteriota bacterium]MCI0720161.1 hypothetical protein [Acidobacteriota bacterium]
MVDHPAPSAPSAGAQLPENQHPVAEGIHEIGADHRKQDRLDLIRAESRHFRESGNSVSLDGDRIPAFAGIWRLEIFVPLLG